MASVNQLSFKPLLKRIRILNAGTENKASQGVFSGYNYSFVTNGSSVTFTFELLDKDKTGVVAYLWRKSPFAETPWEVQVIILVFLLMDLLQVKVFLMLVNSHLLVEWLLPNIFI